MTELKTKKTHVTRNFHCTVCDAMHKIKLRWSLLENQAKFPFSYIYFHGDNDNILTTLYLDANLNIRGSESLDLNELDGNFLSQKKTNEIMRKLARELANVRSEYKILNQKYNDLREDHLSLKFDITILKTMKGLR